MKKKIVTLLGMTVLACTLAVGCGSSGSQPSETEETAPEETAATAEETASGETAGTTEDTATEEAAAAAATTSPLPPYCSEPEEVAAVILFLCDPASRTMTGAEAVIDCGAMTF